MCHPLHAWLDGLRAHPDSRVFMVYSIMPNHPLQTTVFMCQEAETAAELEKYPKPCILIG
jgi:hypothetical protein